MSSKSVHIYTIILLFIVTACGNKTEKKIVPVSEVKTEIKDTLEIEKTKVEKKFVLTEENAIPFFYEYEQKNKENKVKITTRFGSFTIELFEKTPYHRANFIYLVKKGYFNNTFFHRVVEGFIIQGGNSDNTDTTKKRAQIGSYLLPPDTKKGYKHHRGIVSVPSSEIDNPHKLASPYEFFIVVQNPGAYHLDGQYTAFGKVVSGMKVVDKINQQETDKTEWPMQNISMKAEIVE